MNRLPSLLSLPCLIALAMPAFAQEALPELSESGDVVPSPQAQIAAPLDFVKPLKAAKHAAEKVRGQVSDGSKISVPGLSLSRAFGHIGRAAVGVSLSAANSAIPIAANAGAMYMITRAAQPYGYGYHRGYGHMPMGMAPMGMAPMMMGASMAQPMFAGAVPAGMPGSSGYYP